MLHLKKKRNIFAIVLQYVEKLLVIFTFGGTHTYKRRFLSALILTE